MTTPQQYNVPTNLDPLLFRAYDIRGIVNQNLTEDSVYAIGLAIGSEAKDKKIDTVAIGRDGRLSGPTLSKALSQGILDSGCNVIDIGMAPTPVLYYATVALKTFSGVMLTGSHNPPNYNGLKIILGNETLKEESIQALYTRILQKNFHHGQGQYQTANIIDKYIEQIASDIKLARKLKIIIDCGNGITGMTAPQLFRKLGCEVIELFTEVDGTFPNHHPDPSQPENLHDIIAAVKQHHADVGLAFDGDGDRLGVITNQGEVIWPDRQLMLFAKDVLEHHANATIIFDVKCTRFLFDVIKQNHGIPMMWKTGHSLIKAKMREINVPLAGEMSGHIFFKDRWYGFDDGMYVGARLLEILSKSKQSISAIFHEFPNGVNTPELKLAIADDKKFIFIKNFIEKAKFQNAKLTTLDGLRVDFADGWGLIRPSNTTPYLILRFEADSTENLKRIQELFRQQLLAFDDSLNLPF